MKAHRAVAVALVSGGALLPVTGMAQTGPGDGMGPGMRHRGPRSGPTMQKQGMMQQMQGMMVQMAEMMGSAPPAKK